MSACVRRPRGRDFATVTRVNVQHPSREGELLLPREDEVDDRIGPYRVVRRLEVGPTSETVLAVSEGSRGFERFVDIKRLLPHAHADPDVARSFSREATAYARLTHPAIVSLYDYFSVNGLPAMALEHVDGVSLQRLLEALRDNGERLSTAAVMFVGARVFAALSAAHAARDPRTREFAPVIHRDVSPANVLITRKGEVKLTNFGFAKLIGTATVTSLAIGKGTFGYMAPEQLLCGAITVRTDVYAGALLVREMLAGHPAFPRGDLPYVDYLQAMAKPALASIDEVCPGLPPEVVEALERALEPDPEARAITAVAMQRVLVAHREGGRQDLAEVIERLGLATRAEPPLVDGAKDAATDADDPAIDAMQEEAGEGEEVDELLERTCPTIPSVARVRARRTRTTTFALVVFGGALAALLAADAGSHSSAARASSSLAAAMRTTSPIPSREPASTPASTASAASTSSAAPTASATSIASDAVPSLAPPPAPAATTGSLRVLPSSPVHRVFVDGRLLGSSGAELTVPCGAHSVRIGQGGKPLAVDVPCGGQIDLSSR